MPKICSIPDCGGRHHIKGLCRKHHARLVQTGTTDPGPKAQLPLEVRFWKFVEKAGPDDCWLWTGAKAPGGYGKIGAGTGRSVVRAHRVSWEIANGRTIPDGMLVMHRCDNPPCVNPAHLSLGDHSANAVDMVAKGRKHQHFATGSDHGLAVLNPDLVRYIRSCAKPTRQLARELGVDRGTIQHVRAGKTWKHVT